MQRLSLQSSLLFIMFIVIVANQSLAQVNSLDLDQLSNELTLSTTTTHHNRIKLKFHQTINPFYWMYKGSLRAYQKIISPQIASSCIFEISCSRFSNQLVNEYGITKGFFLSLDRITRCNRVYHAEASPLIKNSEGKIIESVKELAWKNE